MPTCTLWPNSNFVFAKWGPLWHVPAPHQCRKLILVKKNRIGRMAWVVDHATKAACELGL